VRCKKASLLVKYDFSTSLVVLFQVQIMLFSKHVWHQNANVLSHYFLTVPSKAFFKSVADFEHPAARILISTNVYDYCLIAEQHVAFLNIVLTPQSTTAVVTSTVMLRARIHHLSEVGLVCFVKVFLTKLDIVPDYGLVFCIHN
jgi:hypothetical protein